MSQQQYRRRLRESGESLFPSLTRAAQHKPLDQPLHAAPIVGSQQARSISIDAATNGSRVMSLSAHTVEHVDDDYIPSGAVRDKLMVFGGQQPVRGTPERRSSGASEMLAARKRSQEVPFESHNVPAAQSNESPSSSTISSQTEVLFSPSGDSTLIDRGNYKANVQILIAELDAAKDLNKKLSMQLARVERDWQSLSIQQDVQKEQIEATIASRVADAVKEIKAAAAVNNDPWTSRSHRWANGDVVSESELLLSAKPVVRAIESQTDSFVEADTPESILKAASGGSLSPSAIAENCDRMMSYIKQHGCQLSNDDQTATAERAASADSAVAESPVSKDKDKQFEAEIQRLQNDLTERDNKISALSQSLAKSESRSEELSKQNLDLNRKTNESERKLATAGEHLEQIAKRQSESEQLTRDMRQRLTDLEQQLSARDEQIERLEAQRLESEQNNKNLSSSAASLRSASSRGQEQFEELAHQQLTTALADRNAEIDRLRAKLVAADRDRATWEAQRKALEATKPTDVKTILSQKRELTMQLDREQNEKHELFLQINTYIAQLADSKKESAEAQQNERALKAELNRLKSVQANQAQLEADVTELQAEVRRKNDEVEKTRSQLAEVNSNFDTEREKLTNEINELDKELQLKSAALQTLRLVKGEPAAKSDANQVPALEATVQKVTARNNDLESQLSALQTQLQERQTQCNSLSAQQAASQAEIASKDQMLLDKTSASEELQVVCDTLRQKVAALEDDNSKSQHPTTITSLEASLKMEEEKNSALQESNSRLEGQLEKANSRVALLESGASKDGDKAGELENVLKDANARNATLESTVTGLEKELSDARAATITLQQSVSAASVLEASLANTNKDNTALKAEVTRLEAELAEAKANNNKEHEVKDAHAHNTAALESTVTKLEKELSDARAETATLQQSLSAASALEANLANTNKDNMELKAQVTRLEAELAETKANNDQEPQKAMEAALAAARAESAANKEALVKTTVQLAAAEASLQQLKGEVKELNNRPSSQEVESLSAEISAVRTENAELKTRIAGQEKESDRQDLMDKVTALSTEKERLSDDLDRISMRHEQSESKWNHELYDLQQKFRDADETKHKLEDEVDELKRQLKNASQRIHTPEESPPPQAPPRRVNDESVKSALEENQKLKAELDKQQRLVSVLRRKLQHAQTTTG